DISPYAGQTGELRFTVPWLGDSVLDGIQFSSTPIPEPSALPLGILGLICLAALVRRANKRLEPTRLALSVYSYASRCAAQPQRSIVEPRHGCPVVVRVECDFMQCLWP